ncbi:MAG: adenine phosphoribosyltransferase [Cyclobacteriaceae bacterium]|nr:adenine phosphoribosyltransferase [Cyclobacteriaceae bacterium]
MYMEEYFKQKIRNVPNFPKEGIMFRDITTLINDKESFRLGAEALYRFSNDQQIDKVVGIESRGFIFGGLLAHQLGAGLVLVRKPGKLPYKTLRQSYVLEYGEDILEIHTDAIKPGERILLHDDLLATGGTARAACDLIEKAGGVVVQLSFIVELAFLGGKAKFEGYKVDSLVTYQGE